MKNPAIRKSVAVFSHLLYWAMAGFFLNYFAGYLVGEALKNWFVALLLPVSIVTTYFFTRFLIPRFLIPKKYLQFARYSLYAVILSVYLEIMLMFLVFIFIADLNMHLASFEGSIFLLVMYLPVLGGAAIKLYTSYQHTEKKNLQLLQQKTEAELKFLKSQIHPHFLFNTLNNLYAQTLEKSDRAPETVLQLSELLSYILYEGNKERVLLSRELEQLNNYIELEKLRYSDRVVVAVEAQPCTLDLPVIPLMFLPLMENAFKHGVKPNPGQSEIRLKIDRSDSALHIHCTNTVGLKTPVSKSKGIGLQNLEKRLSLSYGDRFSFQYGIINGLFDVKIQVWETAKS